MRIVERVVERRNSSARWAAENPVLLAAEEGYDTTVNRSKIGDGVTPWASLKWRDPVVATSTPPIEPAGTVWLKPAG